MEGQRAVLLTPRAARAPALLSFQQVRENTSCYSCTLQELGIAPGAKDAEPTPKGKALLLGGFTTLRDRPVTGRAPR